MASENRVTQINGEMLRVLSALLRQVKDPRVQGLASITRVEVSRDLSRCRVYVSVLEEEKRGALMKGLASAAGFLRGEAGRLLSLRHAPQLQFLPDDSIREGTRILELLAKAESVHPSDGEGDADDPS